MPDKPQPGFALPRHHLVALEGRDALAFAQAQFMSDVRALQPGQWHWSGWLTPKGRVAALFALLVRDPETAWLVLHDAEPDAFASALRRFVFRSKVSVSLPAVPVSGAFTPPASDGVALDFSGEGGERALRLGGEPGIEDPAEVARWDAFDLRHGLPRLPADQLEQWTPQQLSLERLRAFSVKKGCYPGQEIVSRTHFLGKAKRGLRLLESGVPVAPGDPLGDAGGATLGQVVCVAAQADGRQLIHVVAPLDAPDDAFRVHGRPAPARAFLGGLARPV